mmetsp:Transcript_34080/g.80387  ORF Transcript_34080/g.80387 Transcript_34080/m.80387 type:complete len:280 (-) Transcript_34080:445-1284(-)
MSSSWVMEPGWMPEASFHAPILELPQHMAYRFGFSRSEFPIPHHFTLNPAFFKSLTLSRPNMNFTTIRNFFGFISLGVPSGFSMPVMVLPTSTQPSPLVCAKYCGWPWKRHELVSRSAVKVYDATRVNTVWSASPQHTFFPRLVFKPHTLFPSLPSTPLVPGAPSGPAGPCGPGAPLAPSRPGSPSRPGGPCGPVGPCGPRSPSPAAGGPIGPMSPLAPGAPGGPLFPGGPSSPRGPSRPLRPSGPCGPTGPTSPWSPWSPESPSSPFNPLMPLGPVGP